MAVDKGLLTFLMGYVTEHKKKLFQEVFAWRTRHLTVVMENIYQPQNASAVLRTCECLGVQDIHFITEKYGDFETNAKVDVGSSKWLTIHEYDNTPDCLQALKQDGYRLVATSPRATLSLEELPIEPKTALVFGEELNGLAEETINQADELITIPMHGFTESFNLSVSAALCLQSFLSRLHQSDLPWQLTQEQIDEILLVWAIKSIRSPEALIKYYHENIADAK